MEATTTLIQGASVADTTILHQVLQNVNGTIVIAVSGWIFALLLQSWNIRQSHRVEVRYDIYKQLIFLYKPVQNAVSQLSAHTSAPFIQMDASMIPFNLKLEKEYKGTWMPYTESECVFEGEKKWSKFTQTLMDDYFDYIKKYISILYVIENWSAAVKPLLPTKKILHAEVDKINHEILEDLRILQGYAIKHGHDWRGWNQKEIEDILLRVSEKTYTIGAYLSDFLTLLHNQLLSGYFWYKKPLRRTLYPNYKVLTKKGIVVRLERKREKIIKDLREKGILTGDEPSQTDDGELSS
jgi:hypothetical protein